MKIGIIGDGQLALMLGEAAEAQGIDFLGYGADFESSFAVRFPHRFISADQKSLVEFARLCDVLTLENEFLSAAVLDQLEIDSSVNVIPDPKSYAHFQDKISQRKFFQSLGIASPRWCELTEASAPFAFPFVMKAAQGGYDGYGVRIVHDEKEFAEALTQFKFASGAKILIEEKVKIVREFAQGILLDGQGNAVFLPCVETVQKNGTCVLVFSRSTLPASEALVVQRKIRAALDRFLTTSLQGLFNFEFFYTESGEVWINEGAPRPHNSQHLTIEASPISQYALLMQYLDQRCLPKEWQGKEIPTEPAVMINLLGKSEGAGYSLKLPEISAGLQVHPKLYLKKESRKGRKLGHVTVIDSTATTNLQQIGETILKDYEL